MKLVVQNSFSKVDGDISPDAEALIRQVLTYRNDIEGERGQLFFQLKMAKRHNNKKQYYATLARIKHLEANEYVCLYKDRSFPTGLLNLVMAAMDHIKYVYQLEDLRERTTNTTLLRWNNTPFTPRYYQKEMLDLGLQAGRGVFVAAVGSGKSLVMAYLIKELNVNSLIIVPSVALSGQLYNDFCEWFGSKNVQLLDAAKIRKLKKAPPISIVTVQSLASLKKTGEFKQFAKHIDAVFTDELHHASSDQYQMLLEDLNHVYYRYGFTGTFMRNDNKILELWGFLSNVLYEYAANRAIAEGFLTPLEVYIHSIKGVANKKYQTEYEKNYCGDSNLLRKISEIVQQISNDSQILILVKQKDKCGLIIHEYLNALGIENTYLSGDNSKNEINSGIEDFNDKKIRILVGSSVFGEGCNICSTDHLIMASGGKSEIAIVQAVGRAVRLFEGKKTAYVHDFKFTDTEYMEGHCDERIEIYQRNFNAGVTYL